MSREIKTVDLSFFQAGAGREKEWWEKDIEE